MATEHIKCLIVGSGPAGYTAAIYASRANMSPVLYTGLQMGGQLTITTEVENFPGYPNGVQGPQLMEDLRAQAERLGTEMRFGVVTSVDFSVHPLKVTVDETTEIEADTVIIATGATAKYLAVDYIGLIIAVDRLFDMGRTTMNITGDIVGSLCVTKWENGKLNS